MPVYETTATFIVTPSNSFKDIGSFAAGLDILGRRTEIATTYAEVATSQMIKKEVANELNLSPTQTAKLSVQSKLRAGTNVLEIKVTGNDPALITEFTNQIGVKTMAYAQELYEVYGLNSLDPAALPSSPAKPNKVLNIALGAVFGLALGAGMAFLAEYLQVPFESITKFNILDEESGAHNMSYFTRRLGEEMSRARRNRYPLSLALMNVDQLKITKNGTFHQTQGEILRKMTVFLRQYLREEDVIARFDDTIFAFLLPDMSEAEAKTTMERLQARILWTPLEIERDGIKLNLSCVSGVAAYNYNGTGQDEFLARASRALQRAEATGYGEVYSAHNEIGSDNKGRQ